MRGLDREERRKRARANAEAFRQRAMQPQAVARPWRPQKGPLTADASRQEPPCSPHGRVIQLGAPHGQLSNHFRELQQWRGWNFRRVLDSSRVSQNVFEERMKACQACPHCTAFEDGALTCRCCLCPSWRPLGDDESWDLRRRNWYAANVCPADPPRFWLYEPAEVEPALA